MRDVVARTGLPAATLRMWETRYGFPEPGRLPSGHRRYSDRQVELIRQVLRDRDGGLSLPAAIERARSSAPSADEPSIFAGLRRRRPDLVPYLLPKRVLVALSHAIEDECLSRAERAVMFASFQRERFYRDAEPRWREFARTAQLCATFADFDRVRRPRGRPVEVPLDRDSPMAREWSLVCDAPDYAACLAAWEHPGQEDAPDGQRVFETIWTVEPELVREASRIALGLCERGGAKDLRERADDLLEATPAPSAEELRLVTALTGRMVAYIGGSANALPAPHSSPRD